MSHKKKNKCDNLAVSIGNVPLGTPVNPYDFVIVGAGTAGAPLAKFLTDDLSTTVLVLEGGEYLNTDPFVLAAPDVGTVPATPKYDWEHPADYASLGLPFGFNPGLYTDGRGTGGSSAHNYGQVVRGTPDIYDSWATFNPRWAYNNILPAMLALETYTPNGPVANPAQRGSAGPLFTTQDPSVAGNAFVNAVSTAANAPQIADYNDPSLGDVGVSAFQIYKNPLTDERSWAASAFLGPTIVTPTGAGVGGRKLTIQYSATAQKVLIEDGAAVGVRYIRDDVAGQSQRVVDVFAKKVILAAGTIVDAAILQRSGIGPSSLLTPLGIPVVVDNPNVGANVQCHVGPSALIPQGEALPPPFQKTLVFTDLSGANVGAPTGVREIQFIILPGPAFLIPRGILNALEIPFFAPPGQVYLNFVTADFRPSRLSTVQIQSADETVEPLTRFHLYEDAAPPTELDKAVAIYKIIANISLAYSGSMPLYPPASHYPAGEYPGGTQPDDTRLRQDAQDLSIVFNHAVGSCRMGTSIADGVVDGDLNVFGVQNLSCCSNSVQPSSTTGNTAWPAYIIGMIKAKIEGATVPF